ncbi:MAG: sigma-70 family RNA polymerase sigma factor, partial [Nocardioides sp.]|nr:sigma-70 family RNA polymerase sigma factor [Nocardioides sp.]
MSTTLPRLDGPADAELISAVRGGDIAAYGDLFARHVDAARRLARQLVSAGDVDDLVSDAFAKVLGVLQRGGGPDVAFRAYLLTALRRLHIDRIRANSKLHTTGDLEPFDPGVPFRDTAVEGFESAAAAKAFASLPERWQLVLWHTEVEGQKPAEVAALLGMSANSVAALAYRAREGLRQAFLTMHVQELDGDDCRWTNDHVGAYIRKGISRRDAAKVEGHLDECRPCMAIYLELTEVNSNLSGILAPLLLGAAATGYVASASGVAAKGGLVLLAGRARDLVVGNAPATAVAGVAATAVIATTAVLTLGGGDGPTRAPETAPSISAPADPTAVDPTPRQRRRANSAPARATSEPAPPTDGTPSAVPEPATAASDQPAAPAQPADAAEPPADPPVVVAPPPTGAPAPTQPPGSPPPSPPTTTPPPAPVPDLTLQAEAS